jgi:hypothetical protein
MFRPPNWAGEPNPEGYVRANKLQTRNGTILSQWPSAAELYRLVTKYAYDGHATFAALPHSHQPWSYHTDRKRGDPERNPEDNSDCHSEGDTQSSFVSARPYAPGAPTKTTTKYKLGLSREAVMERLRPKRWGDAHKSAVYEVLSLGRDSFLVAASLRVNHVTVKLHCSQIRREIARENQ